MARSALFAVFLLGALTSSAQVRRGLLAALGEAGPLAGLSQPHCTHNNNKLFLQAFPHLWVSRFVPTKGCTAVPTDGVACHKAPQIDT